MISLCINRTGSVMVSTLGSQQMDPVSTTVWGEFHYLGHATEFPVSYFSALAVSVLVAQQAGVFFGRFCHFFLLPAKFIFSRDILSLSSSVYTYSVFVIQFFITQFLDFQQKHPDLLLVWGDFNYFSHVATFPFLCFRAPAFYLLVASLAHFFLVKYFSIDLLDFNHSLKEAFRNP